MKHGAETSNSKNNAASSERGFETIFGKNDRSDSSKHDGEIGDRGERDIDRMMSCLINLQIRGSFYRVEGGLMVLLRKCLESEAQNSTTLLSGYLDHFQSLEFEDVGWGCGWRNIQMLTSHLLVQRPEVKDVLFGGSGFVPDISSLQRWLEVAWERDFDPVGADHFNHKIYGSAKWIGTTECATIFRSFGLAARIVDFGHNSIKLQSLSGPCLSHRALNKKVFDESKNKSAQVYGPMDRYLIKKNNDTPQEGRTSCEECSSTQIGKESGTAIFHSRNAKDASACSKSPLRKNKGHQVLIDWVWNYFSDNKFSKSGNHSVFATGKAPLYFQHDGHSRTIVGIQVTPQRNGMHLHSLLILDPAHRTETLERALQKKFGWQKLIKRGIHTLKKQQYQLCFIDGGIANGKEIEQLKTLDSVFFEF